MAAVVKQAAQRYTDDQLRITLTKVGLVEDDDLAGRGYTMNLRSWTMEEVLLCVKSYKDTQGEMPKRFRLLYPNLLLLWRAKL